MPYVKNASRESLDDRIESLARGVVVESIRDKAALPGLLNYSISATIMQVYQMLHNEGLRYTQVNEIMGVLECIKQELYRRSFGPYEDKAIEKNGDLKEFEIWKV